MINTTHPTQEGLRLNEIHKSFGATQALGGVSFEVHPREILAVLGPSGCGKSTLLTIIAGLLEADRGQVLWEGKSLQGAPPHQRGFGLMFQDFALFPHMDVFSNVAFGLNMQRLPKTAILPRVQAALELVGLPGFEGRDVNTLSGGEQQRVALARSLAPQPNLLMLDEPLGSLDRNLRERLVADLHEILRKMEQTAIYVTHDQEEAFTLADRVVVMNAGLVEQIGSPQDIYQQPASAFVARFVGLTNILPAKIRAGSLGPVADTKIGLLPLADGRLGEGILLLRPDTVRLDRSAPFHLEGVVTSTTFRGSTCRAVIRIGDIPLVFDFPSHTHLPGAGQTVQLSFHPQEAIQLLDR